jgi:hypothetical protein
MAQMSRPCSAGVELVTNRWLWTPTLPYFTALLKTGGNFPHQCPCQSIVVAAYQAWISRCQSADCHLYVICIRHVQRSVQCNLTLPRRMLAGNCIPASTPRPVVTDVIVSKIISTQCTPLRCCSPSPIVTHQHLLHSQPATTAGHGAQLVPPQ